MKNDRVKRRFLWSFLLIIALTACSNQTKPKTSSNTTKEPTSELTRKEQNILKNGYKIDKYTFYLTKKQKEKVEVRNELLSKINEIEERYQYQKSQIDLNKKINIFVHGMMYDKKLEKYELSCFLMNTSGEDITSFKFKIEPKFKNIIYNEQMEFESNDNIEVFPNNSFFTVGVFGNIPKEDYPKLSKNTAKDIQIEIKDLEINGKKVDNEK